MLILIPVNSDNPDTAEIVPQFEAKAWARVEFEDGEAGAVEFFESWEKAYEDDFVDFVILANKFENYMEIMEMGSMILVPRHQKTIDEIMEAFKFKELDEIGL